MRFKLLCRWALSLSACVALAGPSVSQESGAARYAVLKATPGVSADALRAAVDPLFGTGDEALGETRALIILHRGEVVAERYAPGYGPQSRFHGWSIAKTVTGLLVGLMVSDGRLALDDPAPVAAWRQSGDPRGAITLRELMQMRSGLQNAEIWRPAPRSDPLDMLVGEGAADQAAFAAGKPLVHAPGKRFAYSSATSMILSGILGEALAPGGDAAARHAAMMRFIAARFAGPLGLERFVAEYDARGTMIGGALMHMSARDYARIGELIRLRGRTNGRQVVSDRWFDFMLAPSPANAAYGGQIWLNRASEQSMLFPGEALPGIAGAVGNRGQFLLVSPAQGLTIVRLGNSEAGEMPALRRAMARLARRFPAG